MGTVKKWPLARYYLDLQPRELIKANSKCLKFKWENETCDNPPFRWDLCEDHYNLRTETHEYYKATENEYNGIKRNESDEDRFEQRHKWLLLTIAARDIHTELFFKGSPSYEHEEYVKHLHWKMQEEENVIYMRGKGFIVEGASFDDMLSVAKASMRQACFDWVRSDKSKYQFLVYHATQKTKIVSQRKASGNLSRTFPEP